MSYKFKIIKKSNDNFVVVNETLGTHSHLPNFKGCKILLHLINKGEYIRDDYLRAAKERLIPVETTEKHKTHTKDKYYNRSKAQRKACGAKFARAI